MNGASGRTAGAFDAVGDWMRDYVDAGVLPGAATIVCREGETLFAEACGWRDVEGRLPLERDTIVRIYSMTKPVTSVAALMLVEAGAMSLDDPVARFIPSFAGVQVNCHGGGDRIETEPARRPMTIRHLLTHTAGLTYGEGNTGAVSRLYGERRTDFGPDDGPLPDVVERLATIPLLSHPGERWSYGVATDVLGRVVEVVSGLPLDGFLRARIFGPLGMVDTGFEVAPDRAERFSCLYGVGPEGGLELLETVASSPQTAGVTTFSGGAGLVSTLDDYLRFAELLRREGELDGVRLLQAATVELMVRNHLEGDLAALGAPTFNETTTAGIGFGLGVSVVVDPDRTAWRSSAGEFAWGGYASTAFWVDPLNALTVVFLTQLIPSDAYPLRSELRSLVYDVVA